MSLIVLSQAEKIKQVVGEILKNQYIIDRFSDYGFHETRLRHGYQLCHRAILLKKKEETSRRNTILDNREHFHRALHEAYQKFSSHIKIARRALPHKREHWEALQLSGNRKIEISGWLKQAHIFYQNIHFLSAYVLPFGLSTAEMEQSKEMIEAIIQARASQKSEYSSPQNKASVDIAEELYLWYGPFTVVAKEALSQEIELLKKISL